MATCSPTALLAAGKCFCGVTVRDRITARLALLCQRLQTLNPMATCNPNSLIAASKGCWCKVTTKDAEVVELQLLAQILQALSPGAAIDIPSLMAQGAACFCGVTTSPFEMVRLQLLCDIQAAGGGGGGPCPQDMQVSWTPTNLKLGSFVGLDSNDYTVADSLFGIQTITYNWVTNNNGLNLNNGSSLQSIHFPNAVSIGSVGSASGQILMDQCNALTLFDAPNLVSVEGNGIALSNLPSLVNLNLPKLAHVPGPSGDVNLYKLGFTTFTLPSLIDTGPFGLNIVSCPNVTTLSFPVLVSVNDNGFNGIQINSNPLLTSTSFPVLVPPNGINVKLMANSLNATSVNQILARCVANPAYVSGTVDLSGGTNAAPTGQGIADKATLQGRGCTVLTN